MRGFEGLRGPQSSAAVGGGLIQVTGDHWVTSGLSYSGPGFGASVLQSPSISCVPGDLTKFGRGDASSPAPATTLAQPQQSQTQTHHTTQQTFLNPALPPGYSYTSLPYYTGVPGLPSTFQYGPAVFPVSFPEARRGIRAGGPRSEASPHSAAFRRLLLPLPSSMV